MAPQEQDPHQGGDLSSMAATGTSIPNDAGRQNLIPSVPGPDDSSASTSDSLASAATNQTDAPRSNRDTGLTGEVVTGTGDQLPASVESKRLGGEGEGPAAKGHGRDGKHGQMKESHLEKMAGSGAEVEAAPGEEGEGQDEIREGKDL